MEGPTNSGFKLKIPLKSKKCFGKETQYYSKIQQRASFCLFQKQTISFFSTQFFLQAIAEYIIGKYKLHNFPPSHGDYSSHTVPEFSEPEVQLTEKKLIFIVQMMEIILSPTSE